MKSEFQKIDIQKVIKKAYLAKLEEHRKKHEAYEWSDFEGTPVYVEGKELFLRRKSEVTPL